MNYSHLSDSELLNYLDLTNDDPLVRRLIKMLVSGSIRQELTSIGMDPTSNTFEHDYQDLGPADYIEHLRRDIEWLKDECDQFESELESTKQEAHKLKTRSVAELISELNAAIKVSDSAAHRAAREAAKANEEREEMKSKLKVWNHLRA